MDRRRVVVGVDGSAAGRRALTWALDHAADAEVVVVTAFEGTAAGAAKPHSRSSAHKSAAARRQHAEVAAVIAEHPLANPLSCRVLPGPAAKVLAEQTRDAEMLVLGSHGHGPVETRL